MIGDAIEVAAGTQEGPRQCLSIAELDALEKLFDSEYLSDHGRWDPDAPYGYFQLNFTSRRSRAPHWRRMRAFSFEWRHRPSGHTLVTPRFKLRGTVSQ